MASTSVVEVYVYDLSNGMMATMSEQFLGKRLDGLWHTAVVAYGVEYFFGGGIQQASPGSTAAGAPTTVVGNGTTEVPQWMFEQFLDGIRDRYTAETYNLLDNNCNNFADEAAKFLTGTGVPENVSKLPDEFLSTPLGTMMAPLINGFYSKMGGGFAPVGGNGGGSGFGLD
eukprot:m.32064 g.32064  ORF g.32064 m.32064 type:complete len:171 (+) comp12390_c0_seq1:77-589(+)